MKIFLIRFKLHQSSHQTQLNLLGTHLPFTLLSFQELPLTVCFRLMPMSRTFTGFTIAAELFTQLPVHLLPGVPPKITQFVIKNIHPSSTHMNRTEQKYFIFQAIYINI